MTFTIKVKNCLNFHNCYFLVDFIYFLTIELSDKNDMMVISNETLTFEGPTIMFYYNILPQMHLTVEVRVPVPLGWHLFQFHHVPCAQTGIPQLLTYGKKCRTMLSLKWINH
jgi:hypothetical protein